MERTLFIEAVPFKQALMKIVLGYFSVPGGKLGTREPSPPRLITIGVSLRNPSAEKRHLTFFGCRN